MIQYWVRTRTSPSEYSNLVEYDTVQDVPVYVQYTSKVQYCSSSIISVLLQYRTVCSIPVLEPLDYQSGSL